MERRGASDGFTLIEMAVVLVIIGLIVGGVLVGRDLTRAAEMRAQLTQIEKYNTAVNTFKEKYGDLPGDINASSAAQFGFVARSGVQGRGDSNGVIEGYNYGASAVSSFLQTGEPFFFWEDLSVSRLIDGAFNKATDAYPGGVATPLPSFLPQGKLGTTSVFVYSDKGINYLGLLYITQINGTGIISSSLGLTVQQAYQIDVKVDDGLPQTGRATATYINTSSVVWAGTGSPGSPYTTATPGSSTTCFDNGNSAGVSQQYSVKQNNGAGVNCALSFRFQ